MYKTLADMTPEQRAACVGMWCDVRVPFKEDQKNLVILTHVDSGPKRAKVFGTGIGMTWSKRLQDVTPRCDLPRAWTPQGQPVPGEWEEGYAYSTWDVEPPAVAEPTIEGQTTGQLCALDTDEWEAAVTVTEANQYERIGKARRWVGDWEQA